MSSVLPHRPPTGDSAQGIPTSRGSTFASSTPSTHSNSNGPRKPDSQTSLGRKFVEDTPNSSQPKSVPSASSLRPPKRRLKSQYPADSPDPHVEYILVASFHVDRGPIMEHQYPDAISGDEHMLAELMLPDQTHVRAQDWTMFFLHKDTGSDDEGDEAEKQKDMETGETKADDESDEEETSDGDDAPLMYVLNLVNTKQDTSAKRGAVVKSMAVCTRHPFLHIYKPLLLLALEDYFKSPSQATLASVYNAVNSMDLSLMPRLSYLERHILQATDRKDMFIEKFEQMIEQRVADEKAEIERVGGDPSTIPSSKQYAIPRDTHEFESKIVYNDIAIPVKVPTAVWPETVGDFSLIKLIQTFSSVHASSPQPFSLHPHLTTSGAYTNPIIVLVNAILTQKRVIFLGHNRPSSEVAEAVLAACSLASGGILRGFTRHAFPYTDLTKVDELLKVPGFIAGVTNPAFANHHEWWDLMCDLPSGRMKISTRIDPAPVTEGTQFFQHPAQSGSSSILGASQTADPTGDNNFMEDVLRSISSRHGEGVIRAKWRAYVTKFTRISAAFEEAVYGATALYVMGPEEEPSSPAETRTGQTQNQTKNSGAGPLRGHGYVWPDEGTRHRDLAAWVARIEGWRNTRSYYHFIQDTATLYLAGRPVKSMDVHHHHDRLRTLKLPHAESGAIYIAFNDAIRDYNSICQLLSIAPESQAGLFYVSMGLFHPHTAVRDATVELLDRIVAHEVGKHFWAQLSRFLKLGYLRAKQELERRRSSGQSQQNEPEPTAQESKAARILGNSASIPKGRKS